MRSLLLLTALLLAASSAAHAVSLLQPGDFIIGIDETPSPSGSGSTFGEGVTNIFDGNLSTKYFNFGGAGSGFIATLPSSSPMGSFKIFTANDSSVRDPATYQIYGTNSAISSGNNSGGEAENWTLVSSGTLSLPDSRLTSSAFINTNSSASYTSWKVVFPTTKGDTINSYNTDFYFQIADFQGYKQANGGGGSLFTNTTSVLAIDAPVQFSASPYGQRADALIDDDDSTKYLNMGQQGAGFIVTPTYGASIVNGFSLVTADDAASYPGRNPTSYAIYGTNQSILSPENSAGAGELWTLIASGALNLPATGFSSTAMIPVNNSAAYTSYKMVFPSLVGGSDSFQLGGVYFEGTIVPEASSCALISAAGMLLAARRKRRWSL